MRLFESIFPFLPGLGLFLICLDLYFCLSIPLPCSPGYLV